MRELTEKIHMLETMKYDFDISKALEKKADNFSKTIGAELSAFFVAHAKDNHIDSTILRGAPNGGDISRLKQWAGQLPKNLETAVKRRKLAYLSMGLSDMELYVQAMVGLLMLPMAIDNLKTLNETVRNEFDSEFKRQTADLGFKGVITDNKVEQLANATFQGDSSQKAFWKSFDKSTVSITLELVKAIQQGVSAKEWSIIVGGHA